MHFPPLPQLETSRLILREFRMSDLEGHHRHITSDPEVAKTMLWQANPDIIHAEAVLRRILSRYGAKDGYRWAIIRKEDDAFLGTISLLRPDEETGSCSFAYMLGKAFWGNGYMTEALKAVLDFAFQEMDVETVETDHFASNPASGAVMRKAGMTQIGILPNRYEKNGQTLDAVLYRITREQWLSSSGRREGLDPPGIFLN